MYVKEKVSATNNAVSCLCLGEQPSIHNIRCHDFQRYSTFTFLEISWCLIPDFSSLWRSSELLRKGSNIDTAKKVKTWALIGAYVTSSPFRKLWQTNSPTGQQTDRSGHREVTLPTRAIIQTEHLSKAWELDVFQGWQFKIIDRVAFNI